MQVLFTRLRSCAWFRRHGAHTTAGRQQGQRGQELAGLALGQSVGRVCFFAAPTVVRRLVDAAERDPAGIDGIKTIAYGGGPMYVADIRPALSVMGARFVQVYCQGESPMTISALSQRELADSDHTDYAARLAYVRRAMEPVEVAVMIADGAAVAPGVPGEVVVCGYAVMRGDWNNHRLPWDRFGRIAKRFVPPVRNAHPHPEERFFASHT